MRRKWIEAGLDAGTLGNEELLKRRLAEAVRHQKRMLRLSRKATALAAPARSISARAGVAERELRSGNCRPDIVRGYRLLRQEEVRRIGYSWAGVARFLAVTTSAVN